MFAYVTLLRKLQDHKERIVQWMIASFCLLALAFSLDFYGTHDIVFLPIVSIWFFCCSDIPNQLELVILGVGMHMNKALYTPSYTCITAGTAGVMFTGVYVLVDIYGYRKPTLVMEWLGMHALMVYILLGCNIFPLFAQGFYLREPENNIVSK